MLIRHTFLYLPAQLIGPLAQFAAAVVWTHWMAPDVYGVLTFVFAAQELAYLVSLSWWSQFTLRYFGALRAAEAKPYRETEGPVLAATTIVQAAVGTGALVLLGVHPTPGLVAASIVFTVTRSMVTYLGERARAQSRIFAYTVAQTGGPVVGFALALLAVVRFAPTPEAALAGFAVAQWLATMWLWWRLDLIWIPRRAASAIVRKALIFGLPIVVAGGIGWISLNGVRLLVDHVEGAAAMGLFAVGWGLGQRLAGVVATLVSTAAFPLAVKRLAAGTRADAFDQLAKGGTLLIALVVPAAAGLWLVTPPLVALAVSPPFQAMTLAIMPIAAAAGAVRNIRVHFADQVLILCERNDMGVVLNAVEAAMVVGFATIGLALRGLPGAAEGCLVGSSVAAVFCFILIRRHFDFPLPWRDSACIVVAAAVMTAVLLAIPWNAFVAHPALHILAESAVGGLVYVTALLCLHPVAARTGWRRLSAFAARP